MCLIFTRRRTDGNIYRRRGTAGIGIDQSLVNNRMSLKQSKAGKASRKHLDNYILTDTHPPLNNKDTQAYLVVLDYLSVHGYHKSLDTLKVEAKIESDNTEAEKLLALLDSNSRVEFFSKLKKDVPKEVREKNETYQKLEFYLLIYFLVTTKKDRIFEQGALQAFKMYLEARGKYISEKKEYLPYFALPYIPEPVSHPAISHIFKKEWLAEIRSQLEDFLQEALKDNTLSQLDILLQKNKDHQSNGSTANFQLAEDREKELLEAIKLSQEHYQQLQSNYKEMIDAAKEHLFDSQAKWFNLAKQVIQITKKFIRVTEQHNLIGGQMGSMVEKIKKYEVFLNNNVDDMISNSYSASVFDQPTYEDIHNQSQSRNIHRQRTSLGVLALNYDKMSHSLIEDSELNVCLLLQALRWRVTKTVSAYGRREIIMGYTINDVLGLKSPNSSILKRLLGHSTSDTLKEQTLRFINTIESDYYGRSYMLENNSVLQRLVTTLKQEEYDGTSRRLTLNALQKLSLRPQAQMYIIDNGIIHWIIQTIKLEREELSEVSFQYLTALLMNMTLKKAGQEKCEKEHILQLLVELLEIGSNQIRTYVSGSIYSLMSSPRIREEAKRIRLLSQLHKYCQNPKSTQFSKQISYIIDEMEKREAEPVEQAHTDQEEENDVDDIDQEEEDDNDQQFQDEIEGSKRMDKGEELLLKKYSCVGPDALRQEYLTRSILEEAIIRNSLDVSIIKKSSKGERGSIPVRSTIEIIEAIEENPSKMKENSIEPSLMLQNERETMRDYDSNKYLPKYQSFRKKNITKHSNNSQESIQSPKLHKITP